VWRAPSPLSPLIALAVMATTSFTAASRSSMAALLALQIARSAGRRIAGFIDGANPGQIPERRCHRFQALLALFR